MTIQIAKRILILGILVISFFVSCKHRQNNQTNPNVLFIAVDDLRPTLGCYGDDKAISPNIDQLASQGILFNRAYCQQAVCNPSRASIMTGLRPDQIGVTNLENHFREKLPDVVTLPQLFSKNGYEAVAIGKIYHGSKKAQDSISWTKPSVLNLSIKADEYALPENKTGKKEAAYECADLDDQNYEDGQITKLVINQLQDLAKSDNPFFLAVGYKKPHLPFCAPKKYWDLYDPQIFDSIPNKEKPKNAPEIAFHNSQELRGYKDINHLGDIDKEKERMLWHGYYSCVSFVDNQIGILLNELKKLKLDKNTVIILWGDHGYHLGEQELWCKSTNFELDARIPLIISSPTMAKIGLKTQSIVEAVDIYPTLADLCGLTIDNKLAGLSLKSLLTNPEITIKKEAFSQFIRPYGALNSKPATHMGYSIRTDEWRCTAWFNVQNDSIEFTELYNLKDNNIETVNYAGLEQYREIESNLVQLIKNYRNMNY